MDSEPWMNSYFEQMSLNNQRDFGLMSFEEHRAQIELLEGARSKFELPDFVAVNWTQDGF